MLALLLLTKRCHVRAHHRIFFITIHRGCPERHNFRVLLSHVKIFSQRCLLLDDLGKHFALDFDLLSLLHDPPIFIGQIGSQRDQRRLGNDLTLRVNGFGDHEFAPRFLPTLRLLFRVVILTQFFARALLIQYIVHFHLLSFLRQLELQLLELISRSHLNFILLALPATLDAAEDG